MSSFYKTTWLAGIAIFSMFFGAGNVIFPLKVGLMAGDQICYAIGGLLLTAIGGPMLGLVGATLYRGNCREFFCRSGNAVGFIFIATSLFLLGPTAVIPRCFVISHSSFSAIFDGISLFNFSLPFGLAALLCALKPGYLLTILGRFLSPILLFSLVCIIALGLQTGQPLFASEMSSMQAFVSGIYEGYNTMDLIASIFFSSSIWTLLMIQMHEEDEQKIAKTAIFSGAIAGFLLGLIYIGLGFACAFHAQELMGAPSEKLMSLMALKTLGPFWGQIANVAIFIACFTTIVSLLQTIGNLLCKDFFTKLRYRDSLIGMTALSIAMASLGFSAISAIIHPAISICYPAIIVLTICNIIDKIYGITHVKKPVYGTLCSSTLLKVFAWF